MNTKNMSILDIALIKWSVFFAVLFLVSVWPSFTALVISFHWVWFLGISLLLAIKPTIDFFK